MRKRPLSRLFRRATSGEDDCSVVFATFGFLEKIVARRLLPNNDVLLVAGAWRTISREFPPWGKSEFPIAPFKIARFRIQGFSSLGLLFGFLGEIVARTLYPTSTQ